MNYPAPHISPLPQGEPSAYKRGFTARGLRLWRVALAPLLALTFVGLLAAPTCAVQVLPLSETGYTPEFEPVEPSWSQGNLISAEEWKRYSSRPHAFGPPITLAQSQPAGAAGYVRDPVYLPVTPLRKGSSTSRQVTTPPRPVTPPTVTSPTVSGPAAPVVPGLSSVKQPTAPAVSGATAPVAMPYSSTAAPTGPVTPQAPSAAAVAPVSPPTDVVVPQATPAGSPSIAAGTVGQGGVMDTGRSSVSAPAQAGNRPSGMSGSVNGAETSQGRRQMLSGPASSLVVPPPGISLTPNNGSGALTSSTVPQ